MDIATLALIAIVSSVSAVAGAFVGAQCDRVYSAALLGLLLGPLGVLHALGLLYAWVNAPTRPPAD